MITIGGWLILATQLVVLLTAIFAAWKATRSEQVSKGNSDALHRLEVHVDGRLSQLLELTKTSSHAEGVIEGQAVSPAEPAQVEVVKSVPVKIEKETKP